MTHKEIIIVGGGPIGLVAALLLIKKGFKVTILDSGGGKSLASRVLALSYASVSLLKELGVWSSVKVATNINEVHISHKGFGVSRILASELDLPILGCTIKYKDLCQTLKDMVLANELCEFMPAHVTEVIPGENYATISYNDNSGKHTLTANISILADGGRANISGLSYTTYDYNQTAIVATLATNIRQSGSAYERFGNDGGLVLLPFDCGYTLVWSFKNESLEDACLEFVQKKLEQLSFMDRFGGFSINEDIHSFPLKLHFSAKRVINTVVLIGNSAQTIHPVSAQGMNLGLRDAKILSDIISETLSFDTFNLEKLKEYDNLRHHDAQFVINFTHNLAQFMDIDNPIINHIRGSGIVALSKIKPLKNLIANSLIFGN